MKVNAVAPERAATGMKDPLGGCAVKVTVVTWLPWSNPYQSMLNGQPMCGSFPGWSRSFPSIMTVPLLPGGPPAAWLAGAVMTSIDAADTAARTAVASKRLRCARTTVPTDILVTHQTVTESVSPLAPRCRGW